jgi:2-oxoisovalerate dehydrogenase E1 component alpha subunit
MDPKETLSLLDPDGQPRSEFTCALSDEELVRCFSAMLAVRSFDDICMKLQRGGRIGFSIPNRGVEATQIGAAAALQDGDHIFPSYRDFGMAIYKGVSALEMFHNMFGNGKDVARGRQMAVHFSFVEPVHFFSISSPIGTQLPQAVGAAHAFRMRGEPHAALASFGDGGTSSNGFHSGLNFAAVLKAPVVFLCQNNGWAISCPSSLQTGSESYAIKAVAYGMPGVKVDGNDVLAVHQAVSEALVRARAGEGPTLIEAETFRMGGHSTSDDPSKYVPKETLEEWAELDPVKRLRGYLELRELWTQEWEDELVTRLVAEHAAAAKQAEAEAPPGLETIFSDVFESIPDHLRKQGEAVFDLARRKGDPAAGDGAFPL